MRRKITIHTAAFLLCSGTAGLSGCAADLAELYGFGPGRNGNPNTRDGDPPPEGTTRLTAITFSPASGFPQRQDPARFELGGGSITASGGTAGTLGQPGLYADDAFAWDYLPGAGGRITFDDLEVVTVDGYWVHPDSQSAGATMTVNFSDQASARVESARVAASVAPGQTEGFFDTVSAPPGQSITSLSFEFDTGAGDGDVAALDVLELTVRQPRSDEESTSTDSSARVAQDAVRTAMATLHPMNQSGILANIEFVDDGSTLFINGTATGLDPAETYLTLIYDNGALPGGPNACVPTIFDPQDPEFLLGRMVIGAWDVDADGNGTLSAINTNFGLDYVPIGRFRAVSVRRVLGPPPAPGAPPPTQLEACGRVAIQGAGN